MDPRSFDALARSLAAPKTRRGLLGGLAALGAGLLGARASDAQVSQTQCGNVFCGSNPGVCTNGCVCCVYGNGNSRCRPCVSCSPGTVACPPGQVLGPSGVCAAPTTTTTTIPPPTTTATTTTPTTTTTTTAPPLQGTCTAGADFCGGTGTYGCNGNDICFCATTMAGATACVQNVVELCGGCTTDAESGPGGVCVRDTEGDCGCGVGGGFCEVVCPPAGAGT